MVWAKGYTTSKLWFSKALLKSIPRKKVPYKRFLMTPFPKESIDISAIRIDSVSLYEQLNVNISLRRLKREN